MLGFFYAGSATTNDNTRDPGTAIARTNNRTLPTFAVCRYIPRALPHGGPRDERIYSSRKAAIDWPIAGVALLRCAGRSREGQARGAARRARSRLNRRTRRLARATQGRRCAAEGYPTGTGFPARARRESSSALRRRRSARPRA